MGLRVLRVRLAAFATVTAFGVAAAVAGATPSALTVVHSAQNTALGKILVTASGRTLYHDSAEKKNVVKCLGSCASQWPPLLIAAGAKPVPGPGVTASLLGTVKRPDGKLQVTYAGLPLYLFKGDAKAGDVKGQGQGGLWHALTPTGAVVTKAVTVSSGGSTSGSSSGSTSGSGSGSTSGSGTGSTSGTGTGSGTGGTGTTGGTGGGTDCTANPQGYGCM
jgi:predicted lipoprotein with Yx(FWY)xxD motif